MSRTIRLAALVAVLLLALAACGGDDGGSTTDASEPAETTSETAAADASDSDAASDDATADTTEDTASEETEAAAADGEPVTVGVVTTTSGLLGGYGSEYLAGLEAGLDYATDGSGAVNGRPVELNVMDDAGDPEQAISAATDLVGQGVTILAGTASSGVAIQMAPFAEENDLLYVSGPAASDAVTGVNANTFRSGRQTYQDVATAASLVEDIEGANVLVLAQDSEFGAGNFAAVEAVLGGEGASVDSLLVPLNTTEFTPFAQQVIQAAPDLLFVAWAGDTTASLWQSLEQQGVFDATTVTTGLGDSAAFPSYGESPEGIEFLAHYFPEAPDNEVNDAMVEAVDEPDLFTPDGFVAAQMIVQALTEGDPEDTASMIAALEGWTFDGPKGEQTVREGDHAMLQPMFTANLTAGEGGEVTPELLDTLEPDAVAPPESSGE